MKAKASKLNKYFRCMIASLNDDGYMDSPCLQEGDVDIPFDFASIDSGESINVDVGGGTDEIPLKEFPLEVQKKFNEAIDRAKSIISSYIIKNVRLTKKERNYILDAYRQRPGFHDPNTDKEIDIMGAEADKRMFEMLDITQKDMERYQGKW